MTLNNENSITSFTGEYRWLSNFWPVQIKGYPPNDLTYLSVENAYVAAKSLDPKVWDILTRSTPGQAKRFGRTIQIRPDWDYIKFDVMQNLLTKKFQKPELQKKLLATKSKVLIEGNTWGDRFWGCTKNGSGEWTGQNVLGQLLMKIRATLREAESDQTRKEQTHEILEY